MCNGVLPSYVTNTMSVLALKLLYILFIHIKLLPLARPSWCTDMAGILFVGIYHPLHGCLHIFDGFSSCSRDAAYLGTSTNGMAYTTRM